MEALPAMLDGEPVGFVVEHRPWRGSGYGGQRWIAAHNPSGGDWSRLGLSACPDAEVASTSWSSTWPACATVR